MVVHPVACGQTPLPALISESADIAQASDIVSASTPHKGTKPSSRVPPAVFTPLRHTYAEVAEMTPATPKARDHERT